MPLGAAGGEDPDGRFARLLTNVVATAYANLGPAPSLLRSGG
jgi:hypothetical protein